MVGSIHLGCSHVDLWSNDHVITCKSAGILNGFFVYFNFYSTLCFFSLFISGNKRNIFRTIAIFGSFCLAGFELLCFLDLPVYFIFLFCGKFWIECYDPFFCKFYCFFMSSGICAGIRKIIYAFLDTVQYLSSFVLNVCIVIFKQDPCFFRLRKSFYRFGEDVSITSFQCMCDVIKAVKSLIRDLDRSAGYVTAFFKIINDVAYNGFFTFIPRIHFHTDRDLVGIQEQAHTDDRFPAVFFWGAFQAEIIFFINLKVKVCTIKVCVGRIKRICLIDLVVIDLDHLFVFGANVLQTGIQLVQWKIVVFKEIWDNLIISFWFRTGLDCSCIN